MQRFWLRLLLRAKSGREHAEKQCREANERVDCCLGQSMRLRLWYSHNSAGRCVRISGTSRRLGHGVEDSINELALKLIARRNLNCCKQAFTLLDPFVSEIAMYQHL